MRSADGVRRTAGGGEGGGGGRGPGVPYVEYELPRLRPYEEYELYELDPVPYGSPLTGCMGRRV